MTDTWREKLEAIRRDCSKPNWNSYGALPIRPAAVDQAQQFIDEWLTTKMIDQMIIVPTPDGEIELAWRDEVVAVAFDGTNVQLKVCPDSDSHKQFRQVYDLLLHALMCDWENHDAD